MLSVFHIRQWFWWWFFSKHGTVATNTGTEAAFTNIPSTVRKSPGHCNFGFSGSSVILLWKLVIVMDMLLVDINPLMIPLLRQIR